MTPLPDHGHAGNRPTFIANCLPLRVEKSKPKTIQCALSPPPSTHHGAAANVAYAFGNSNGNVPDEWVFGYQGADPFTAQTGNG